MHHTTPQTNNSYARELTPARARLIGGVEGISDLRRRLAL